MRFTSILLLTALSLSYSICENQLTRLGAKASSFESGTTFTADKSIDGKGTTRWNSNTSKSQWLEVDLGTNVNIERVQIVWDKAYATHYTLNIGASSPASKEVVSNSSFGGGISEHSFSETNGRHLRLNMTSGVNVNDAFWGYSVKEIVIYGGCDGFSTPPVIPLPSQHKYTDEGSWNSKSGIEISDDALTTQWKSTIEGYMLESSVPSSGIPLKLKIDSALKHLGIEGYEMDAKPDGIKIRATTQTGLFYGLQTLRQFWKSGQNIDAIEIVDVPSNSWRGFMLDIARNFMPLEYLKLTVDRMAILKLNRFHLHLTDDQGWRIEVKSWPKLHTVGSQSSTRNNNGYLTQVEYKELDEYARLRGVVLVPEIDLPGHTNAVKAAYPQFGCGSDVAWPYKYEQVGFSKLCLEKTETYDFVQEVVEEVMSITSGPWFHVGGDEVADVKYKSFISWLDTLVTNQNKVMVGWQEIHKGSTLSSNTIWQIWKHGTSVPDGSNPMLNSSCANAYFDHPEKIGGPGLTWCSSALLESEVYQIKSGSVGMEAALWGERLTNSSVADDMMYPRLIAMAEASWTPDTKKNYNNFVVRRGLLEAGLFAVKAVAVPTNVVVAIQKSIPIFLSSVSYMDLMGRALGNKPSSGAYLERLANGTIIKRIAN